jgi:hypothetical protein
MEKFNGASLLLVVMLLGLGACATTPGAVGSPSATVRYEAESGQILNSSHHKADVPAGTERQSFYSGGLAAGGLNKETPLAEVLPDWSNLAYVRFTVKVGAAGDYVIKVHYNGDDDKTILVRVNGGQASTVPVPRMGDGTWNVMWDKSIPVTLKAGTNTVDVSGTVANAGWMNIDYIDVAPSAP